MCIYVCVYIYVYTRCTLINIYKIVLINLSVIIQHNSIIWDIPTRK